MVNCILVFCSLRRGFNNIWERQRASKLVGLEHLFLLRGGSEMNWTGWPKNTSAVAMIQSNPWFRTCDFGIRPRKHQGSANSHGRIRLQQVTLAWYDISETMMVYMWHVVYMWIYALITSTTHETMRPFQRGDEHPSPFQLFLGAGLWPIPIVSKIHSETDFASDVQYCHMDADVILFIHKHIYICACVRVQFICWYVCVAEIDQHDQNDYGKAGSLGHPFVVLWFDPYFGEPLRTNCHRCFFSACRALKAPRAAESPPCHEFWQQCSNSGVHRNVAT